MRWLGGIRTRIGVNADLCRAFPHRSMDLIKGLRKNEKYQWLRSRHEEQGRDAPPTEPNGSPIRDFVSRLIRRESGLPRNPKTVQVQSLDGGANCSMR